MSVLTRYLLRAHLAPFLFAFGALTGLIVVNTMLREIAELQGKGLPWRVIAEFLLLSLPPVISLALPMAVLVAVIYAFSQMAAENEITALQASGVDLRRAVLPILVAAAGVAGGMLWFNDRVLPATNHRLLLLTIDIARTSPLLALREQVVNPIETAEGPAYLLATRMDAVTGRMQDVTIVDTREPGVSRTIYADSGRLALTGARTDIVLSLYDGHLRRMDFAQPASFERIGFRRYLIRMPGVAQGLERSQDGERTDRTMTIAMMRARLAELRGQPDGETAPGSDLRRQIRSLQVEIHKKYSIAFAALVFVLIGVPLALRFRGGGVGLVIALSLPVFTIFYIGLESGESLAETGHLSPVLGMWMVNGAMTVAGVWGLSRLGRGFGWRRG